jgi:hypothetical protein
MVSARPELNGFRLYVPGQPELWLIFHGMRHHVASPDVHDALFSGTEGHTAAESVDSVLRGPDLNDGTCLARGDGEDSSIYLVTGFPASDVQRHRIVSWETFVAFGFDESLVRVVPALILSAVKAGRDIEVS